MTKIIYSVVKSLIYKEKVLIIVEDHDDFKDKKVILHPNYFGDWWERVKRKQKNYFYFFSFFLSLFETKKSKIICFIFFRNINKISLIFLNFFNFFN